MKHLYFGDGKGKTTAAVGIAVRAAGSNLKVLFVQFLKTEFSGERHVLSHTENVTLTLCPADLKFTFQMNEKEKTQAAKIFKGIFDHSVTLALTEKYDMVVFDEIIDAINAEMLTESEVVEFITNAPSSMEIIMTGHNPSQKMIDLCDYVTEFKKIKHPYDRGITGRIGVEFYPIPPDLWVVIFLHCFTGNVGYNRLKNYKNGCHLTKVNSSATAVFNSIEY